MPDAWDVVVIGGGIHGVGVAQAAAAAGHRVLLLEERALAAGTSRCSSGRGPRAAPGMSGRAQ